MSFVEFQFFQDPVNFLFEFQLGTIVGSGIADFTGNANVELDLGLGPAWARSQPGPFLCRVDQYVGLWEINGADTPIPWIPGGRMLIVIDPNYGGTVQLRRG